MQWGDKCQSFSARRYPPLKSITKQFSRHAQIPRCQLSAQVAASPDEPGSVDSTSPPRRARSKPPLRLSLVALVVLLQLTSIAAEDSNSTDIKQQPVKLRLSPAARHAEPQNKQVQFECTGGQPPYRWEYHVQDLAEMVDWRYKIRLDKDNCKPNVTTRSIPESSRIHANSSTGVLYFDRTDLADTGIYRCFSSETPEFESGCIELHLLVFEELDYYWHIRLIYGLFAIVIFLASLSTAWQLWNSSAFNRRNAARSRGEDPAKDDHVFSSNPVLRLFSRSRAPHAATKPAQNDSARWPVLRRRLSSIEEPPVAVITVPADVIVAEESSRVDENHA